MTSDWWHCDTFTKRWAQRYAAMNRLEMLKVVYLSARMDTHTRVLSEEEFIAVLDALDKPATDDVRSQLEKTMATPYPWQE